MLEITPESELDLDVSPLLLWKLIGPFGGIYNTCLSHLTDDTKTTDMISIIISYRLTYKIATLSRPSFW